MIFNNYELNEKKLKKIRSQVLTPTGSIQTNFDIAINPFEYSEIVINLTGKQTQPQWAINLQNINIFGDTNPGAKDLNETIILKNIVADKTYNKCGFIYFSQNVSTLYGVSIQDKINIQLLYNIQPVTVTIYGRKFDKEILELINA